MTSHDLTRGGESSGACRLVKHLLFHTFLGGGFIFLFSPLFGEDFQFD